MDYKAAKETQIHALKAISVRELTPSTYVLRFERNGIPFRAGQHILLGINGEIQAREYSVYSAEGDDYFEVLIKEVQDGMVSKQLRKVKEGDTLHFENPVGYFIIPDEHLRSKKFLFIASGSGIAPFHSYVRTYPELDYRILHGVRFSEEAYDRADYDPVRHVLCTSRDRKGDFHGRVTDWLKENPMTDKDTFCYLCGNCEMIHEAYDILLSQGIPSENLFAEVYF
jgi:ferredoxin/flavodoxin---NADP+ reductase